MATPLTTMIEATLLRELRSVRLELEAYPEEGLIWRIPPGIPNSGGTLVLHLAGNIQHYIGAVLGGSGYVRDREREFSARDVPRRQLLEEIASAETAVRATLPKLDEAELSATYTEAVRDHHLETAEFLVHVAVHLGYHLGQLSYHRRLVSEDPAGVGAVSPAELSTARPAG
jgi:uncharacterized damage-inducible protein DinB